MEVSASDSGSALGCTYKSCHELLVCVHVLANALSLVVVLFGTCHQQEWTLGGGGC